MSDINPYSNLSDVLQAICDGINHMQNNSGCGGVGIDQYQLFQKLDDLRSTIDNMGGHVGMLANQGQLIEGHLETISSALVKILEGDDDRLMERLKAKVKATYADERGTLLAFVQWAEKQDADFAEGLVDRFLEEVGET